MPRSIWKGPFFDIRLLNAIQSDASRSGVQTYARSSTIIPDFVGAKLLVHDGKQFVPLVVREDMIGMRLGTLVPTKKPFTYRATNASKKTAKK
jgi:ribosomal protein S19